MLISKFNRMIRNRLLWGVFAVIISISFVGLFTSGGGCEGVDESDGVAGTVDGLTVTHNELQRSRFFTMLQFSLMTGRPFDAQSPEMMQEFENMAWRRALALQKAEDLGLRVTNREVLGRIQQDPMFAAEGRFQKSFYDQFADGFLRQIGVSRRQYDEFMREEIMLEKLLQVLSTAVWITPGEMDQHLRTYTDVFTVQTARFSADGLEPVEDPGLDEIQAFYEESPELFAMPERVRVAYATFPAGDYVDSMEEIQLEDLEDYYVEHLNDFRVEKSLDESDPTEEAPAITHRPFEDVEDEIREILILRRSLFAAMEAATDFVLQLVPDRHGQSALSFDQAAAEKSLVVRETLPFSQFQPPPEPADVDPGVLIRHAFRLEDRPDEYFSDAIAGQSAAYVLALRDRIPEGVPPLEEVIEDVRSVLTASRTADRLAEHAGEIRRKIMAGMSADPELTFEQAAAAEEHVEVARFEPFSVFEAPEDLDDIELLQAISRSNAGEITELISSEVEKTLVMAYVEEREPADEMSRNMLRRQLGINLYRHRAQQVFAEWQDDLLDRLEKPVRDHHPERHDRERDMGRRPIL